MDTTKPDTLAEYRSLLLSNAVNLVKMIDLYTTLKQAAGKGTNIPKDFRDDALTVALAAAAEQVNPDNASFQSTDMDQAETLLEILGLPVNESRKKSLPVRPQA